MAFTKTLTCPKTNYEYTDAHCVVGKFYDYGTTATIYLGAYGSSGDVASYEPCRIYVEEVDASDYTTYFAETVLDDADKTWRTQAQAYLLAEVATFSGGTPV